MTASFLYVERKSSLEPLHIRWVVLMLSCHLASTPKWLRRHVAARGLNQKSRIRGPKLKFQMFANTALGSSLIGLVYQSGGLRQLKLMPPSYEVAINDLSGSRRVQLKLAIRHKV